MVNAVTLDQVEHLAGQLAPQQQLALVAHICDTLSHAGSLIGSSASAGKRFGDFDTWLAECEAVAELWQGEFDSAADLRRIRDED